MASFLSLFRTSQLEVFYFPLALKASPLPERPPRLPFLISSLPLPNRPIIFTCLGRAVSSRERGPSAGMMPNLPLDPLSVPWTELCAVLHPCSPSSLSPFEGGSARPGTLSLSSGDSSTPPTPLPLLCPLLRFAASKQGSSESTPCGETPGNCLGMRARDVRGRDISCAQHSHCSSVIPYLLPVGKVPATISFPGLQSPLLSPAPQPSAFQDLGGALPTARKCSLANGVFLLLIPRLSSLVPSSPVSPSVQPITPN